MTWGVAQHTFRNGNACLNENGNMLFDLRCGHIFPCSNVMNVMVEGTSNVKHVVDEVG